MVMAVLGATSCAAASAAASTGATDFGGTSATPPSTPPIAASVTCRTGCGSLTTARPGSTVRVVGAQLADVTQVVFTGGKGRADDVSAPATAVDATHVDAV